MWSFSRPSGSGCTAHRQDTVFGVLLGVGPGADAPGTCDMARLLCLHTCLQGLVVAHTIEYTATHQPYTVQLGRLQGYTTAAVLASLVQSHALPE
jgi:hypothetical protein